MQGETKSPKSLTTPGVSSGTKIRILCYANMLIAFPNVADVKMEQILIFPLKIIKRIAMAHQYFELKCLSYNQRNQIRKVPKAYDSWAGCLGPAPAIYSKASFLLPSPISLHTVPQQIQGGVGFKGFHRSTQDGLNF